MSNPKSISSLGYAGRSSVPTYVSCCIPARPKEDGATSLTWNYEAVSAGNSKWDASFVSIPKGQGRLGTNSPLITEDGEGPARMVQIKPFRISSIAVTNVWFSEFVTATGYQTEAERFGWSLVFWSFARQDISFRRVAETPWWYRVDGADWAHPYGPHSDLSELADHPVTHVSWRDASAFACWMGGRLPTEAEWEHAAKGGSDRVYPWGDLEPTDSETPCNIWQGDFPHNNTGQDGHLGTAPAKSFETNPYGLYNMSGNVWEWSSDAFRVRSLKRTAKARNVAAATRQDKLLKGGSYLCHKSYCYRYRIAARTAATPDSSTGHMGFRVVLPVPSDFRPPNSMVLNI